MNNLDFHLKNLDFISKNQVNLSPNIFQNIKFITDFNYEKKNVFLRLDLNISSFDKKNPKKEILNDLRFQKSLKSIQYLLNQKAKIVIAAHKGRPKKHSNKKDFSLQPIATVLGEHLKKEILFVEEPLGDATRVLLSDLKPNQLIFLENLRFSNYEIENSPYFSNKIAEYTHIYINDAFGVSHRKHGSVFGLPKRIQKKALGFLIKEEIENLEKILNFETNEKALLSVILGGSKVEDKMSLIENLMEGKNGSLFLGGAMAYIFLKAKNVFIQSHFLDKEKVNLAKELIKKFENQKQKIFLPLDHKVIFKNKIRTTKCPDLKEEEKGIDIGPKTIEHYKKGLNQSKLIFWNGPLGIIEKKESKEGTLKILEVLAESSAFTVIGGGDSAKVVQESKFKDKINFVSTGGGASLEYLQKRTLPGIEALRLKQ